MTDKDEKYRRAQKRVDELKGFYSHLSAYLAVNALMFFYDVMDGGIDWFYWVAIPWGIFVVMHWFNVNKFGRSWEERKIKEIMDEEK